MLGLTALEVATRLAASGCDKFSMRSPADLKRAVRLVYSYSARHKLPSYKTGGALRFLPEDVDRAAREGFRPRRNPDGAE